MVSLSLKEAGERYGINPKTLQLYCSYGYLPEGAAFKTSKNGHWRLDSKICDDAISKHGCLAINRGSK